MSAQPEHHAQPDRPRTPASWDARAVRVALPELDREAFDAEYEAALAVAGPPVYDLAAVLAVVERWRRFVLLAPGHHEALAVADRVLDGLDVEGVAPVSLEQLRSA